MSKGLVPGDELNKRGILHKNSIAKNKGLWDWYPIHTHTFIRHFTGSESS